MNLLKNFMFFLSMLFMLPTYLCARGHFTIVGMGTSPTGDLVTMRGLMAIKESQILIVPTLSHLEKDHWGQTLSLKVGGMGQETSLREVYECPDHLRFGYGVTFSLERERLANIIYQGLLEGKKVVWAQDGDPMMYGNVYLQEMVVAKDAALAKQIEIIPSIGALQSATSAIQKNPVYGGDTSSVIVTMKDWRGRMDQNEKLIQAQTNMIVYTMGMVKDKENGFIPFFGMLKKYYDLATPVAVVFDAGDVKKEEIFRTTVGDFLEGLYLSRQEMFLTRNNLLLIGYFLERGQARPDGLGTKPTQCCAVSTKSTL